MRLFIAPTALAGNPGSLDVLDLIWNASGLVQLVIALLLLASVISWAVIFFKWREFRSAARDSEAFFSAYRKGDPARSLKAARKCGRSPAAAVYLAAAEAREAGPGRAGAPGVAWASGRERQRLEARLSFLATTGSAAPFVGLFGTVVGIINAFTGIGISGNASLVVVAPGIAEALVATAVGLLAAIPATVFYNHFVSRLRNFSLEIALVAENLEQEQGAPNPGAARAAAAEREA